MNIEYDPQADAIYIKLIDEPYAYGKDIDNECRIDYSKDDKLIGIELLCVGGIELVVKGLDVKCSVCGKELGEIIEADLNLAQEPDGPIEVIHLCDECWRKHKEDEARN